MGRSLPEQRSIKAGSADPIFEEPASSDAAEFGI